jgi:hypothetical protein
MIVKLVVTVRFKGKGNGKTNGLNPGYVAQVQNHMAGAILANKSIGDIDTKTDKLCECIVSLASSYQRQTEILGKISDSQIRESGKAGGKR